MKLENVLVVTKSIEGVYGPRINIQGNKEMESQFRKICSNIKADTGLMQSSDTTYEFLHKNQESIRELAFQIAEQLKVPVLFW